MVRLQKENPAAEITFVMMSLVAADIAIFRFVNGFAGTNVILNAVGIFLATYLIMAFVAGIVMSGAVRRPPRKAVIFLLHGAIAVAGALIIDAVISLAFFRERPFVALDGVHRLVQIAPYLKSFPSDHAASAFALAMFVALEDRRLAVVAFVVATAIALGRVFVGVHYPLDVAAGAVVGVCSALLLSHLYEKSELHLLRPSPKIPR